MAAHLMGTIGEIGGDQLEQRSREGYRPAMSSDSRASRRA